MKHYRTIALCDKSAAEQFAPWSVEAEDAAVAAWRACDSFTSRTAAEAAAKEREDALVEALADCLATLEHTRAFMLQKHGTTNPAREEAMANARTLLARHGQGGGV